MENDNIIEEKEEITPDIGSTEPTEPTEPAPNPTIPMDSEEPNISTGSPIR